MQPVLKNIYQVAIVCRDTAAMVKKFADLLGIGPWQLVNFGPHCCKDMTLNGQRADYAMALAGWDTGAFEFEFCQPLDEKSLYAKQLQEYGEGLQHVAYAMDMDFDGAVDFFRKKGISVVQSGNWHGCCGYYYMDTQKLMKHTLEIHNQDLVEKAKYGPEGRYPELGMDLKFPPILSAVKRIGIVVRSLDETLAGYANELGVSAWTIWDMNANTVKDLKVYGEPSDCAYRAALTKIGNIELELIEPLDEKSIFGEDLRDHGERLHHIEYVAPDYKKAVAHFKRLNIFPAQSGNWGGEEFIYFNSQREFKHIIKICDRPAGFVPPAPAKQYR